MLLYIGLRKMAKKWSGEAHDIVESTWIIMRGSECMFV